MDYQDNSNFHDDHDQSRTHRDGEAQRAQHPFSSNVSPKDRELWFSENESIARSYGWVARQGSIESIADRLFTRHEFRDEKDGRCAVPGKLLGDRRNQKAVERLSFMVFDLDRATDDAARETLERIERARIAYLCHSTHSHRSSATQIAHDKYVAKCREWQLDPNSPEAAKRYMRDVKGMPDSIAGAATVTNLMVQTSKGVMTVLQHPPISKFRVVMVLDRDYVITEQMARGFGEADARTILWNVALDRVAAEFGLDYDRACKGCDRAFYAAAAPSSGGDEIAWVVPGACLSLDALLPKAPEELQEILPASRSKASSSSKRPNADRKSDSSYEGIDLVRWAASGGAQFQIEDALFASPIFDEIDRGSRASKPGRHVACPFEDQHGELGDKDFYVVNASDDEKGKDSFHVFCCHTSCHSSRSNGKNGVDRLPYVAEWLRQGVLTLGQLSDPAFYSSGKVPSFLLSASTEESRYDAERNAEAIAEEAANKLTPASPLDDIRAALRLIVSLSALAKEASLQVAAKKTKKSIRALRDELLDLERQLNASGDAAASSGADIPKQPDPADCSDFFSAYRAAEIADRSSEGNVLKVRERAVREGRMTEYELAVRMAELAQRFAHDLEDFARRTGWAVSCSWDGRIMQHKKVGETVFDSEVASCLIITGEAHNPNGSGGCLVLWFPNSHGDWVPNYAVRSDLVGRAEALQSRLQGAGLKFCDWPLFLKIMQGIEPRARVQRIERPGWCGEHYALPSGEVLTGGDAIATFQPVQGFEVGGTREGQDAMLNALDGNSAFVMAYGAGLAASVVGLFGSEAEPGGLHFHGPSSIGKSTILFVAASVWGRGAEQLKGGVVANWKGTELGSEILCEQHSDCLLVRDELNQGNPAVVGESLYMIGNGTGKVRGRDADSLRRTRAFRPTLLSCGETSTESYCAAHEIDYMAGMSVRVLDISAAPEGAQGCFQRVPHEFASAGAFAEWLKQQTATHYGHHGRALMRELLNDREAFMHSVRMRFSELRADLIAQQSDAARPKNARDGQSGRVASRFALYGAVLMAASERGVVPWSRDAIVQAFKEVHAGWLANRGGQGSQEGIAADRAFTAFVRRHPARFDGWGTMGNEFPVRDRVGFTQLDSDGRREFWIASDEAFREMVGGAERLAPFVERLKAGLSEDWELVVPEGSKRKKRDTPRGCRNLGKRAYCIRTRDAENGQGSNAKDQAPDPEDQELGAPDLAGFKLPNRSRAH